MIDSIEPKSDRIEGLVSGYLNPKLHMDKSSREQEVGRKQKAVGQ